MKLEVEDHGNGFMVVGTGDIPRALRKLHKYMDDVSVYRFNLPIWYESRVLAVWLSTHPGACWDGAKDSIGRPMRWG